MSARRVTNGYRYGQPPVWRVSAVNQFDGLFRAGDAVFVADVELAGQLFADGQHLFGGVEFACLRVAVALLVKPKSSTSPMRCLIYSAICAPASADCSALLALLPLFKAVADELECLSFSVIGSFAVSVMRGLLILPGISAPVRLCDRAVFVAAVASAWCG